eukprot:441930-Prymnesium_polylepis.2
MSRRKTSVRHASPTTTSASLRELRRTSSAVSAAPPPSADVAASLMAASLASVSRLSSMNGSLIMACHANFLPFKSTSNSVGYRSARGELEDTMSSARHAGSAGDDRGGRTPSSCCSGVNGSPSSNAKGGWPGAMAVARSAANGA